MFAETTRLLYSTIPETIKIYQDTCDDELFINGDSSLLHQVMMNLVGNACDAVEGVDEPLIKLKLDVYQPDRVFAASYPDAEGKVFAHLSVEDNGYGILEDDIEHIFEPFYTTKEVGKGSGLGLSMVFGAVKTHDGFVQLESSKDNGAIFHIYIPLEQSKKAAFNTPSMKQASRGEGEVILLVDDHPQIIEIGSKLLESLGYQVMTATNGQKAVELFEAHVNEIDLVILDVVMPVMSGDKAAQCIRKIKSNARVIFATGYDKNMLKGMKDEDVISKPFRINDMSELVKRKLGS